MQIHRFSHAEFDLLKWIILLSLAGALVLFLTRPTSAHATGLHDASDVAGHRVDALSPLVARHAVTSCPCSEQGDSVR